MFSFDKELDIDRISATVRNIQNNNPYQGWSEGISVVPPQSLVNNPRGDNTTQEEQGRLYRMNNARKKEQMRKAKEREEYERPLKAFISSK